MRARVLALLWIGLIGQVAVAEGATDPAVAALRASDVYVSPRTGLGPEASERLAASAAELREERGPVKLVVTHGPVGSPSMQAYARRLRRALEFPGTVIVTTPGTRTAVVGPEDPAETTVALRTARIGRVADPVERAIAAGRAAVPLRDPRDRWRGPLALLGIALVGGLWAVAIGMRRLRREERARLQEARIVFGDALTEIDRRLDGQAGSSREQAASLYAEVREAVRQARSADELAPLIDATNETLAALDAPDDLARRLRAIAGDPPQASPP